MSELVCLIAASTGASQTGINRGPQLKVLRVEGVDNEFETNRVVLGRLSNLTLESP